MYWAMDQEMLTLDDTRGLLTEGELIGKMYKSQICGQISWIDDTVIMLPVAGTNQPFLLPHIRPTRNRRHISIKSVGETTKAQNDVWHRVKVFASKKGPVAKNVVKGAV